MCFSATASFSAGLGLLVIGVVAARRTRNTAELPFALIPALFGVQQLVEGALWLALGRDAPLLTSCLTQTYSAFSQILWPFYIPLAVLLLEVVPWRRTVIGAFAIAGLAVSMFLAWAMLHQPVLAELRDHHISYVFWHSSVVTATALYLLGACLSPLVSSHSVVRVFGLGATVSLVTAYTLYSTWFISVWCFFAAVLSAVVLLHFAPNRLSLMKAGRRQRHIRAAAKHGC